MYKSAIEAILSGKKTVETRFSKHRICPYGQVEAGDLVYIKPPGEAIIGQFRVKKVFFFEGLEEKDVQEIFEKYKSEISVGDALEDQKYLEVKRNSRFATLIFVGESERFITSPVKIRKKDLRGWVVLN